MASSRAARPGRSVGLASGGLGQGGQGRAVSRRHAPFQGDLLVMLQAMAEVPGLAADPQVSQFPSHRQFQAVGVVALDEVPRPAAHDLDHGLVGALVVGDHDQRDVGGQVPMTGEDGVQVHVRVVDTAADQVAGAPFHQALDAVRAGAVDPAHRQAGLAQGLDQAFSLVCLGGHDQQGGGAGWRRHTGGVRHCHSADYRPSGVVREMASVIGCLPGAPATSRTRRGTR